MSKESDNKAIVGTWFTDFWGKTCNLAVVHQIAAPNMLLQYSLHRQVAEAEMTSSGPAGGFGAVIPPWMGSKTKAVTAAIGACVDCEPPKG